MSLSRFMYTVITLACFAKFCDASQTDETSDFDLFTQFREWYNTVTDHLINTETIVDSMVENAGFTEAETIRFEKNKEKFINVYRTDVSKQILPKLVQCLSGASLDKLNTKPGAEPSKWKLVGTSIKLLIGISLMHGALAIECVNDLRVLFDVAKGMDDTWCAALDGGKVTGVGTRFANLFRSKESIHFRKGTMADDFKKKIKEDTTSLQTLKQNLEGTTTLAEFEEGTYGKLPKAVRDSFIGLRTDLIFSSFSIKCMQQDASDKAADLTHKMKIGTKTKIDQTLCISYKLVACCFANLKWDERVCNAMGLMYESMNKLMSRMALLEKKMGKNRSLIRANKKLKNKDSSANEHASAAERRRYNLFSGMGSKFVSGMTVIAEDGGINL